MCEDTLCCLLKLHLAFLDIPVEKFSDARFCGAPIFESPGFHITYEIFVDSRTADPHRASYSDHEIMSHKKETRC